MISYKNAFLYASFMHGDDDDPVLDTPLWQLADDLDSEGGGQDWMSRDFGGGDNDDGGDSSPEEIVPVMEDRVPPPAAAAAGEDAGVDAALWPTERSETGAEGFELGGGAWEAGEEGQGYGGGLYGAEAGAVGTAAAAAAAAGGGGGGAAVGGDSGYGQGGGWAYGGGGEAFAPEDGGGGGGGVPRDGTGGGWQGGGMGNAYGDTHGEAWQQQHHGADGEQRQHQEPLNWQADPAESGTAWGSPPAAAAAPTEAREQNLFWEQPTAPWAGGPAVVAPAVAGETGESSQGEAPPLPTTAPAVAVGEEQEQEPPPPVADWFEEGFWGAAAPAPAQAAATALTTAETAERQRAQEVDAVAAAAARIPLPPRSSSPDDDPGCTTGADGASPAGASPPAGDGWAAVASSPPGETTDRGGASDSPGTPKTAGWRSAERRGEGSPSLGEDNEKPWRQEQVEEGADDGRGDGEAATALSWARRRTGDSRRRRRYLDLEVFCDDEEGEELRLPPVRLDMKSAARGAGAATAAAAAAAAAAVEEVGEEVSESRGVVARAARGAWAALVRRLPAEEPGGKKSAEDGSEEDEGEWS